MMGGLGVATKVLHLCAFLPLVAWSTEPSFLIIGVGKCGTSSLYYYLTGHPQVVAASQKQVQWFDHRYDASKFASSYLRHFKPLKAGEVTGEASPGYVSYAQVPGRVLSHLPGVKILCAVRDPASRAYSAYHYNYLAVAHRGRELPFEDLIKAEIDFLVTKCLGGGGVAGAALKDNATTTTTNIDLSSECYGRYSAETQAGAAAKRRFQGDWSKALPRSNAHLWRQLVGRSLYSLYLERWYAVFPKNSVWLVCSERLAQPDLAVEELDRVARDLLNLEPFDFRDVVAEGKYNAGSSHRGFEALTEWQDVPTLEAKRPPMPHSARRTLDDFAKPFNDRLLQLDGHRNLPCPNWATSTAAHDDDDDDDDDKKKKKATKNTKKSTAATEEATSSHHHHHHRRQGELKKLKKRKTRFLTR